MLSYTEMTAFELEQELERLDNELKLSNDSEEIEMLNQEIEVIEDILNERDPLVED